MGKTCLLACLSRGLGRRGYAVGGTGDIRGAGGPFGKKEKAQEEQYFRQKEKEELAEYKRKLEHDAATSKSGTGKPEPKKK